MQQDVKMPSAAPSYADILAAQQRVTGVVTRTPLFEFPVLNERVGGRVLLKAENLQRTGSFKFRGAWNCLSAQADQARANGVVAWSSGNHAQGVALAARELGVAVTIVMPKDAPQMKIDRTRQLGAEIVLYDRYTQSRAEIGRAIAAEHGAVIVQPFDEPLVIAGQGTMGLEIVEQCRTQGVQPDSAFICCGGGGLSSGTSLALHEHWPDVAIHTVEPVGFDDTARSLIAGERLGNDTDARSVCDALLSEMPGEVTFPILREHVASGVVVSDEEALAAVRFAFNELKLVVEPGGAVALAAVLAQKIDTRDRTVVAVLSGGNLDQTMLMTDTA